MLHRDQVLAGDRQGPANHQNGWYVAGYFTSSQFWRYCWQWVQPSSSQHYSTNTH